MPGEQQVINLSQPVLAFHPNPRIFTWEMLEEKRRRRLKVDNPYSRHFNVTRTHRNREDTEFTLKNRLGSDYSSPATKASVGGSGAKSGRRNVDVFAAALEIGMKDNNSLAPFDTLSAKSTCGYYFSRSTVNNKFNIGIPPTNPVKWRTTHQPT